jgi:fatty-acyl-CoA synthase
VRSQTPNVPLWRWPDAERPASDALRALADDRAWQAAQSADATDPAAAVREGLTAGQTAVCIFTSGTTGLPKAAIISHARWLMTGEVMAETMAIGAGDCFYTFLPLYHGAASISAGATSLFAGGALALRRKFSRREFWADVRRYHATVCQYVGEICRYLLSEPARTDDREHSLRKMVGAGLSAETWQRFVERFGEFDSTKAGARPRPMPTPSTSTTASARAGASPTGTRPTCGWCATTSRPRPTRATPPAS